MILHEKQGTHDTDGSPKNQEPNQPDDSRSPADSRPSYWPGLRLLIAAIVIELSGRAIVGLVAASVRGQGLANYVAAMNGAMKIQGTCDVVMTVFVLIGTVLLARVFIIRKRLENRNP